MICNKDLDIEITEFTKEELDILNRLGDDYKQYSEMSDIDRAFLNSLILRKKPKKILEVGVAKGGSSIVILNAIKDIEGAHLYSHDYSSECYRVKGKKTGFYADNFPELKEKWTLRTGGYVLNSLDEIGGEIDFCLLDTAHCCPGEIIDILLVLPYLKKGATVVFHDVNLHTRFYTGKDCYNQYATCLLMSALRGRKCVPSMTQLESSFWFSNIGAVELDSDAYKNVFELFNLLTVKWDYMPDKKELDAIEKFFERFYNKYYCEYFREAARCQKKFFEPVLNATGSKNTPLLAKVSRFIKKHF